MKELCQNCEYVLSTNLEKKELAHNQIATETPENFDKNTVITWESRATTFAILPCTKIPLGFFINSMESLEP